MITYMFFSCVMGDPYGASKVSEGAWKSMQAGLLVYSVRLQLKGNTAPIFGVRWVHTILLLLPDCIVGFGERERKGGVRWRMGVIGGQATTPHCQFCGLKFLLLNLRSSLQCGTLNT
ncbi:hypothetical protein Hanom_Chr12g01088411 [Helianthus anomalus]